MKHVSSCSCLCYSSYKHTDGLLFSALLRLIRQKKSQKLLSVNAENLTGSTIRYICLHGVSAIHVPVNNYKNDIISININLRYGQSCCSRELVTTF